MKYENGSNQDVIFYLKRKALKVATEAFALGRFASKETLPQMNGHQFKVAYFEHLPDNAIQPLQEGVGVDGTDLTRVSKTGALLRQGGFIPYSDEAKEQFDIEFLDAAVTELSYSAGTKMEKDGFTSLLNDAGNVIDVTAVGSWDEALKQAKLIFRKNNTPKLTAIKTGSVKVGTRPVNAGWYLFASPDDVESIKTASDWLSVEDYGYSTDLVQNEEGVIKSLGIRVVSSLNIGSGNCLMIGDGAFADLGLSGKNRIEVIKNELGSGVVQKADGTVVADHLKQAGSIAVKTRNSTMTIFPERLIRFENLI